MSINAAAVIATDGFGLVSVILSTLDWPTLMVEGENDFSTVAGLSTTVGSLAALLARLTSPPPEIEAVLVTPGDAAASTLTVKVTGLGLAVPVAMTALLVQVTVVGTVGRSLVHVHPVPAAATRVSPAGKVSVTEYAPLESRPPRRLLAARV